MEIDDEYSAETLLAEGIDAEWIDLHRWIRTFRASQGISATQFLKMCDLEPSSRYYKKLCSLEMGIVYRPSLKNGTQGKKFRIAATKLMSSELLSPKNVSFSQTIENAVADWKIDNFKTLMRHGVHDVYVTRTSHVVYYVVLGSDFTCRQFIEMLSSDPYLSGQLNDGRLTVEEVWCQLLHRDHCCMGINDGVSSGTGTFVSIGGVPILLTAAHVCHESTSVRINDFDSVVTDKWVPNYDGCVMA
jgi:hypothetical protein